MNCENIKLLLIDYLYDEISEQDKTQLETHLATCNDCQQELQALQSTSKQLKAWPDVNPRFNLVFVEEKASIKAWVNEHLGWLKGLFFKPGIAVLVTCFVIFLVLAAFNTQLTYKAGEFKLSMSLFSRSEQSEIAPVALNQQALQELQKANLALMQELIISSELRQRQELIQTISRLNQKIETQRLNDLSLIGRGFEELNVQTVNRLERTDYILNNLLRLTSMESPDADSK
ncbi:zf-HC2 domain-containing protein [candidate division KSB1 bacterium]|nr:zf-HC2 domain-containing protein [candidate division KSB1 bacterium]